jgi:hypothetical protein
LIEEGVKKDCWAEAVGATAFPKSRSTAHLSFQSRRQSIFELHEMDARLRGHDSRS